MGKSSKDKRDIYYRLAKERGYRARSAFKLIQLDQQFKLFNLEIRRVVDLCAAPGSWTQVLDAHLHPDAQIVAVDLQQIAPIKGSMTKEIDENDKEIDCDNDANNSKEIDRDYESNDNENIKSRNTLNRIHIIQADITTPETINKIKEIFREKCDRGEREQDKEGNERKREKNNNKNENNGKYYEYYNDRGGRGVDLVVCDGAPDVTGLHDLDEYFQHELVMAALNTAIQLFDSSSLSLSLSSPSITTFIAKIFRGRDLDCLVSQIRPLFKEVIVSKPSASRNSSIEAFLVCRGFVGLNVSLLSFNSLSCYMDSISHLEIDKREENKSKCVNVKFVACQDEYDADKTYLPNDEYEWREPIQKPTNPPYKEALKLKRGNNL